MRFEASSIELIVNGVTIDITPRHPESAVTILRNPYRDAELPSLQPQIRRSSKRAQRLRDRPWGSR
jgi:hypothetical protein